MRLKNLSAAALLGAAFSLPATAHEMTFGLGVLSTKQDTQFSQTISGAANKSYHSASDTEIDVELVLGYVWSINKGFDLAFELFYDMGSTETKQTLTSGGGISSTGHAKQTIDGIWGLRVLPGFYVTKNTKIFLDIGLASIDNELDVGAQVSSGFDKTKKSKNSAAYRYGAGVQTMIYDNFSLRMSYVVMDGASSVKVTSTNGATSVSAEPTIHNFLAELNYHFQF